MIKTERDDANLLSAAPNGREKLARKHASFLQTPLHHRQIFPCAVMAESMLARGVVVAFRAGAVAQRDDIIGEN